MHYSVYQHHELDNEPITAGTPSGGRPLPAGIAALHKAVTHVHDCTARCHQLDETTSASWCCEVEGVAASAGLDPTPLVIAMGEEHGVSEHAQSILCSWLAPPRAFTTHWPVT